MRNSLSACGHRTCIVEPTGHHADDGRLLECGLRPQFSSAEEVSHCAPRRLAVLGPAVHRGRGNGGPPVRCDLVEYRLDHRSFGKNCIVRQWRYRSERSASRIGHLHEHLQMGHSPRRVHRHGANITLCVSCITGGVREGSLSTPARQCVVRASAMSQGATRLGPWPVPRPVPWPVMNADPVSPSSWARSGWDVFGPQPFVAAGPRQVLRPRVGPTPAS